MGQIFVAFSEYLNFKRKCSHIKQLSIKLGLYLARTWHRFGVYTKSPIIIISFYGLS